MTVPTDPEASHLALLLQASRAMEDAPEALIHRVITLGEPQHAPQRPAAEPPAQATPPLRRLLALLSFDSAQAPAGAAGLRLPQASTAGVAARQLMFTTEGRDIDVRITPHADGRHWCVSGQVLGPDAQGAVELWLDGGLLSGTGWDELAEFHFGAVPGGHSGVLVLRSGDWTLALPAFDLPRRPSV